MESIQWWPTAYDSRHWYPLIRYQNSEWKRVYWNIDRIRELNFLEQSVQVDNWKHAEEHDI